MWGRRRSVPLAAAVLAVVGALVGCSKVDPQHAAFFDQIQIKVPHQVTDRLGGGRPGDDSTRFIVQLDGELDPQQVLDSITPPNGSTVQRLEWRQTADRMAADPNGKPVGIGLIRTSGDGCTAAIDERVDGPQDGHTEISFLVSC